MITLYLAGAVQPGARDDLEAFLADAVGYYESLGGVRVRLQWDLTEPERFLEIMEYADRATYDADQERVTNDPVMQGYLERWRTLLVAPVSVTAYAEASIACGSREESADPSDGPWPTGRPSGG